ncbi:MAG TPA: hypothetical protein VGN42_09975 [Pirellulales bacterium]|nr:hypothetical protein [Pirellulales bacterium]
MTNPQSLLVAATFMVIALNAVQAEDQDGKSRQVGKYYLALGRTHNMQAHDHARLLQKYAALSDQVPADVIHDHVAAIRFNAEAAKKSFARQGKSAGDNVALAHHVEQLQKRLDKVIASVNQLEDQLAGKSASAKTVAARTNDISQQLRANHNDLRTIDNDFYDSGSDSYYETGEGHFID